MTVYLGLGSNLGDRQAHLDAAVEQLRPAQVSAYLETPALLWPGDTRPQPHYLNAVAVLETALKPAELLSRLRDIERHQGRSREHARWQARPLDLDILLWGEQIIEQPGLTVPHPQMHLRRFVLEPLTQLAPQAMHPVLGVTVRELLERL